MKQKADWLAWFLQGIFGLIVGGALGLYLMCGVSGRGGFINSLHLEPADRAFYLWGAALVGAALASRFGDRLWMRSSYLLLQPEAPPQSGASRIASLLLGIAGAVLIVLSQPVLRDTHLP